MMTILEKVKQQIMDTSIVQQDIIQDRLMWDDDNEDTKLDKLTEYLVWYNGNSSDLLNYYLTEKSTFFNSSVVKALSKQKYFWSISSTEKIKRVHSGIPYAIIDVITSVVGQPKIEFTNDELKRVFTEQLFEENNFFDILKEEQIPLTMAQGWGAFKINVDTDSSKMPLIAYYNAESVDFIYNNKKIVAYIFKDKFSIGTDTFLLLDIRFVQNNNSYIKYKLFKLERERNINYGVEVDLKSVPQFANLGEYILEGYNQPTAVSSIFFKSILNKNIFYGRSIFENKIDLFDDLDQALSQSSTTVRRSTPVDYIPSSLIGKTKDGKNKIMETYDRQYISYNSIPNGDGMTKDKIITTQPQLNGDMYSTIALNILNYILIGFLSPATMGIDVARKDNAEAQREKEKITGETRDKIIDKETRIIQQIIDIAYTMWRVAKYNEVPADKQEKASVVFPEFANPSFENQIQILGQALSNNSLSIEKYVELLWGDKLSEEERELEIERLKEMAQRDNINFGEMMIDGNPSGNSME